MLLGKTMARDVRSCTGAPLVASSALRGSETYASVSMADAPMFNQSDAMRAMAAKYLWLAKDTEDPIERSKFFDYAMIYAQLSEQAEWPETSSPIVERRDGPERANVIVARPHGR